MRWKTLLVQLRMSSTQETTNLETKSTGVISRNSSCPSTMGTACAYRQACMMDRLESLGFQAAESECPAMFPQR
eukprot:757391-Hanusia_phi.AAC.6